MSWLDIPSNLPPAKMAIGLECSPVRAASILSASLHQHEHMQLNETRCQKQAKVAKVKSKMPQSDPEDIVAVFAGLTIGQLRGTSISKANALWNNQRMPA
ncbi:hypothetical protein AC578_5682 [Pseudocercospora eumusae]|uniref:Uncharacterized protein n=1 Tax=Pseudocercospora eumusae TaxID=321146 RepID=A0A139H3A3_9PEZI|nr:hypothetical protein AC578_5682 [Pseudocercospora eumusae]